MRHILFQIVIILSASFVLASCAKTRPMTKAIHNTASRVGRVDNFQYYVSRNIVLTKQEKTDIAGKVAVSGKIKATFNKDIIQITSTTRGVLLKVEKDENNNNRYYVAFETDNDNCLCFVQRKEGDEERLYLLYDDLRTHSIHYGGEKYVVEWKGADGLKASRRRAKRDNLIGKFKGKFHGVTADEADEPYLLVKMKMKIKENEKYRKASGRKVEVK